MLEEADQHFNVIIDTGEHVVNGNLAAGNAGLTHPDDGELRSTPCCLSGSLSGKPIRAPASAPVAYG